MLEAPIKRQGSSNICVKGGCTHLKGGVFLNLCLTNRYFTKSGQLPGRISGMESLVNFAQSPKEASAFRKCRIPSRSASSPSPPNVCANNNSKGGPVEQSTKNIIIDAPTSTRGKSGMRAGRILDE